MSEKDAPFKDAPFGTNLMSPLQLNTKFADAVSKVDRVTEALKTQDIKVSPGGSVGSLFAKVRQLNKQHVKNPDGYDQMKFFAAMEALWITQALEIAVGEPGSREAIRRIIGSEMDLSGRKQSQGKDVLWELDLFRRLKLGGANVRLAEPDIVLQLGGGFGDFGIACKKVYCESGVEGALRDGCNQLKKQGLPGVVAFNLDDSMEEKALLCAPNHAALHAEITRRAREFLTRHASVFQRVIEHGGCDGALISITMVYQIPDGSPPTNLARTPVLYPDPPTLREPARARLAAFLQWTNRMLTAP